MYEDESLFRIESKTFYYSSLFLPKESRKDTEIAYNFMKLLDNIVDQINPDKDLFFAFKRDYEESLKGKPSQKIIINEFVKISKKYSFDPSWIETMFQSMQRDLDGYHYETQSELLEYIYGVAEVVGLIMCKILGTSEDAYPYAQSLGRAIQYMNIIRDIVVDTELNRTYIPREELAEFGLSSLRYEAVINNKDFPSFMRQQISYFDGWLNEAKTGYKYLPTLARATVKTSADMYKWTAEKINRDPYIIYRERVKPQKRRVLPKGVLNIFAAALTKKA